MKREYEDYEMDESVGIRENIFNIRKLIDKIFDVTSGCHHTELSDIGDELLGWDDKLSRMEVALLDFEEAQRKAMTKDEEEEGEGNEH